VLRDSRQCNGYFVATATASDDEMAERIRRHQQERDAGWQTLEADISLAGTLRTIPSFPGAGKSTACRNVVVVDCLTLWMSNLLHHVTMEQAEREVDGLVAALVDMPFDLFIVSNEIGSGIVPLGQLSRQFVDLAGFTHQRVAEIADRVTLVMAGCPLALKSQC
jgi:adenosylcobinamide kinase/adenosylcobinamide-phosphate guanylyltransferase